jgi:hypothetical protein
VNSTILRARLDRLYQLHSDVLMERRPVRDPRAVASRVARRIRRLASLLEKIRRAETQAIIGGKGGL